MRPIPGTIEGMANDLSGGVLLDGQEFGQESSSVMAARSQYPWIAYMEELRRASTDRKASFAQTFMAMYIAGDPYQDTSIKTEAATLYPKLLRSFEETCGKIVESRYGNLAAAGAVLVAQTQRESANVDDAPQTGATAAGTELQDGNSSALTAVDLDAFIWAHFLHFDSLETTELLADIVTLRDRITTFLPSTGADAVARDIALRRLYGLARELIESIDSEEERARARMEQARLTKATERSEPSASDQNVTVPREARSWASSWQEYAEWVQGTQFESEYKAQRPSQQFEHEIISLRARLAKDEAIYLSSMQRLAQRKYVEGMFRGLVILGAPAVAILSLMTGVIGFDSAWVAAAAAGAIGAVLSVLQRIGRGPLDLGPEGLQNTFWLNGFVRPVIGAVLGTASFVLIEGGLVALATSSGGGDRVLYYAGIAFLAGFSERFAQDMLNAPAKFRTTSESATGPTAVA
jgi:hypothetical protein